MRRGLVLLAKAIISLALMTWVVRSLDFSSLKRVATGIGWPLVLAAFGLTVLQVVLLGLRWHRIVHWLGASLPVAEAIRWSFVGVFFNQAMPSSVGGDAVRMWYLHRQRLATGVAFASVAIDRLTGLTLLGLMVSVATLLRWEVLGRHAFAIPMLAVGPTLTVALIALVALGRRPPGWLPENLINGLKVTSGGLEGLVKTPWIFAEAVVLGMAGTFIAIVAAMVLGIGLGLQAGLVDYIAIVGGAVLLAVLPVSLGGWGLRETAMVVLFGAIGVAPEEALALSLTWALLPVLVSLPSGVAWWRLRPDADSRPHVPT